MKTRQKVSLLFIAVVVFWMLDTVICCALLGEGTFAEMLLPTHVPHQLYVRSVGVALLVALGGTVVCYRGHGRRAEGELRRERDRGRAYLDVAPVLFVALDTDGRVRLINQRGCRILGLPEDRIVGRNWFEHFLPQRDRVRVRNVFREIVAGRLEAVEYHENPVLTGGGEERFIAWHNAVLRGPDGRITAILASGEDVTDRRRAEQELEQQRAALRDLAAEVTLAEERERRRLAANLHDDVAQPLASAKIRLQAARSQAGGTLRDALDEVRALLDEAVENTRTSIFDLSPPILHEVGLAAAVQWLLEKTEREHRLSAGFSDDGRPKPLSEDVRAALFRSVGELLRNAARHGRAEHVRVALERAGPRVRVKVEDDGTGFDPDEATAVRGPASGGFGLFTIRQRLDYLGGGMELESGPGRGTRVTLEAPVEGEAEGTGRSDGGETT